MDGEETIGEGHARTARADGTRGLALSLGGLAAVRERTWERALQRLGDGYRRALAYEGRDAIADAA